MLGLGFLLPLPTRSWAPWGAARLFHLSFLPERRTPRVAVRMKGDGAMEELAPGRKEAALKIGQQLLLLQADREPETGGERAAPNPRVLDDGPSINTVG